MWDGYKNYDHYFCGLNHMNEWLEEIGDVKPDNKLYNIPASFDIETTSTHVWGVKYATMYIWSLCINGSTIVGRTWKEFVEVISTLAEKFNTEKYGMIIYVHNLGYEFQWMRHWFDWEEVFAIKDRRPIRASLKNGIEFRCSYILSNYALAYIGDNLISRYKVQKDVGAVDYSLPRHSETILTSEDYWYNVHDVQVVTSFIQEKIENEGGLTNIPLTNTGYVRQYCRNFCFTQGVENQALEKKYRARYHETMQSLIITSECEYDQLKQAFSGGFTHAAPACSGQTVNNIGSADLASSYPSVMVRKKFPMARGVFLGSSTIDDVEYWIQKGYCCLFTLRLSGVTPKFLHEHYISISRCSDISPNAVVNNGRVAAADYLQTVVTEQDYDIIKRVYHYDTPEVHNLRIYPSGYLPRPFILSILKLFGDKTSLKGVEGKETEYMVSKNMINSAYGMAVTDIIRDIFTYSNDWDIEEPDKEKSLRDYNKNYNRFLFYAWGVWVTAHARHSLWEAIFEFKDDYVYCDTDSIKGKNFKKHMPFFIMYNMRTKMELLDMCDYYSIDYRKCCPLTKTGVPKTIGVWEIEDSYKKFKTIGAKRYLYEYENGFLNFTVSGVNKKFGMPYLLSEFANSEYMDMYKLVYNPSYSEKSKSKEALEKLLKLHEEGAINYDEIFENFNEGLYFPKDYTGKSTLTYIDTPTEFELTDLNGVTHKCSELSSIHMEPQSYYMSQSAEYIRFLEGFRDGSI